MGHGLKQVSCGCSRKRRDFVTAVSNLDVRFANKEDIGETTNVADQRPEIMKKINDYLSTARTEGRKPLDVHRPTIDDYVR